MKTLSIIIAAGLLTFFGYVGWQIQHTQVPDSLTNQQALAPSASTPAPPLALSAQETNLIEEWQLSGAARFEDARDRVYVDPVQWRLHDAAQKESITGLFAKRLAVHDGEFFILHVLDAQTGRELATFKRGEGFKVATR